MSFLPNFSRQILSPGEQNSIPVLPAVLAPPHPAFFLSLTSFFQESGDGICYFTIPIFPLSFGYFYSSVF